MTEHQSKLKPDKNKFHTGNGDDGKHYWLTPPELRKKSKEAMTTWYERIAESRPPDFIIGGHDDPYMLRWWVIPRNNWFNIYLHKFLRSDDDRALHCHPWVNMSVLLRGEYTEHVIAAGGVHYSTIYCAGSWKFRRAKYAHRIELHSGPCWSLFITGPVIRDWYFHCQKGLVHWRDFTSPKDKGDIGRGCD